MSSISVEPPYPAFADADGQPLEDGYILIGAVNLNPITNPIAVFFDAGLTISAVQPIRTSGGYPVYQGTPSRIYISNDYSIQVQNKNGTVVYTSLNDNIFSGSNGTLFVNETGTGTQTVFAVSFLPSLIYINGVYQNKNTYTISGVNVTFTQAPPLNSIIEFVF
jgi:hypothetical protein